MRITSLGFRTDVALRVLEGAEVTDRGDYLVVRTPGNPDFWWGNFLLFRTRPGPARADLWLTRFAAEFPAATHVALGVDPPPPPSPAGPPVPAGFLAAGLEAHRDTVLTAPAVRPPPHPNTEAEIRPLRSDADWQQSLDLALRCFGAGEPQEYLRRQVAARQRLTRSGHGAWFGAFEGGRLVAHLGLVDAGGGLARYQHVETDPSARRRGLAGTLIWQAGIWPAGIWPAGIWPAGIWPAATQHARRDTPAATTLVIVADPADAAIRLYRSCGFTPAQTQLSFERPSP